MSSTDPSTIVLWISTGHQKAILPPTRELGLPERVLPGAFPHHPPGVDEALAITHGVPTAYLWRPLQPQPEEVILLAVGKIVREMIGALEANGPLDALTRVQRSLLRSVRHAADYRHIGTGMQAGSVRPSPGLSARRGATHKLALSCTPADLLEGLPPNLLDGTTPQG